MTEADFQTKFNRWLRNQCTETLVAELKITQSTRISYRALAEHQERALLLAKHKQLPYKIADVGVAQKPFDCFFVRTVPAYVVVMFAGDSKQDFYMIDIDDWVQQRDSSGEASLTLLQAQSLGLHYQLGDSTRLHPQLHRDDQRML